MKSKFFFLIILFSFTFLKAQRIPINVIESNKALISLPNNQSVELKFKNYFRATAETFSLVNYKIYENQETPIGKYTKKRMKFKDGSAFKYFLNKKEKQVFVKDHNGKTVFKGILIFGDEDSNINSIEILQDDTNSDLVKSWVALATVDHYFGEHKKSFINDIVFGALVGAGTAIGVMISN